MKVRLRSKSKMHVLQIVLRPSAQKVVYVPSDQEHMEQVVLTERLV